jgi:hypothetical protein
MGVCRAATLPYIHFHACALEWVSHLGWICAVLLLVHHADRHVCACNRAISCSTTNLLPAALSRLLVRVTHMLPDCQWYCNRLVLSCGVPLPAPCPINPTHTNHIHQPTYHHNAVGCTAQHSTAQLDICNLQLAALLLPPCTQHAATDPQCSHQPAAECSVQTCSSSSNSAQNELQRTVGDSTMPCRCPVRACCAVLCTDACTCRCSLPAHSAVLRTKPQQTDLCTYRALAEAGACVC